MTQQSATTRFSETVVADSGTMWSGSRTTWPPVADTEPDQSVTPSDGVRRSSSTSGASSL
jgi:hypothetical protein